MTEKFHVISEEYQDTDDMGYAIASPIIFYNVSNDEIGFNFDSEKEAKMLKDYVNKLIKENEQLKKEIFELKYDMDRLKINNKGLRIENDKLKDHIWNEK